MLTQFVLRKGKLVLIDYIYATTGIYLIDFDDPQSLPYVANHSNLSLSTPFTSPSDKCAYHMYEMTTKKDLVLYLHRAARIPFPSTWNQTIDTGFNATRPGLTADLVQNHLQKIIYTFKGNLRQKQKNLPSTKNNNKPYTIAAPEELEMTCARAYLVNVKIVEPS